MISATVDLKRSVGRGFETPTLNEVAYLAGGVAGLNTQLNAARSHSAELGLRGRVGNGWWSSTLFDIRTSDEIVVAGVSTDCCVLSTVLAAADELRVTT